MKINLVTIAMALVMALPSYADTGGPVVESSAGLLHETGISSLANVFFVDKEEETLFIDFEAINDRIVMLNILSGDKLMMEDDVRDLPANVIYEVNLGVFRNGQYTIELVTDQSIKIQKNIVID
ncbi:MAG: hypothetical protein AAFV95_23695 [Bacteroidota bacterium]